MMTIDKDYIAKRELYKDYLELRDDFLLLFRNAKNYNEEGSQIYEDATKLESLVKKKVRSFVAEDQKARVRHEQTEKNRLAYAMHQQQQQQQRQQFNNNNNHQQLPTGQIPIQQQLQHPGMPPRMYFDPQMSVYQQGPSPSQQQQQQPPPHQIHHPHGPIMMPQNPPPIVHHPQMPPPNLSLAQRMMIEIFYVVKEYKDNFGNYPSIEFIRKPNKIDYPQYYKLIRRPIDLCSIAKGILSATYPDFDSFMNDLQLLFDNACRFYEANSKIYKGAMLLHRVALAKQASLLVALEPNLPPGIAPLHNNVDINIGLRRLLTSLHNTMLTACDSDGRGLVDSLIAGDGTKDSKTSPTAVRLAGLHKAVAAGSYRRLDRLQHDWMVVLRLARIGNENDVPIGEQQRSDAIELTRRWIRLRDEICSKRPQSKHPLPNVHGEQLENYAVPQALNSLIASTALTSYSHEDLSKDLAEEKDKYPLPVLDDLIEGKVVDIPDDAQTLNEITIDDKVIRKNDFVLFKLAENNDENPYVDESRKKELIGRILEIVADKVHLARYMRADEAKPSQRRRLFHGEVFRTPIIEVVSVKEIIGPTVVLHIAKYIKNSVKGIEDSLVNICESHFSIKGGKFIKIARSDEIPISSNVELIARAGPLIPNRLSPIEPLEAALEQVDKTKYTYMTFPTLIKPKTIVSTIEENNTEETSTETPPPPSDASKFEYFDQYVHGNGFHVKLGDYLYVSIQKKANDSNQTITTTSAPMPDPSPKKIMRVEKLWKEKEEPGGLFFSGPSFISPLAVEHLPTRMFYTKETFISSAPHTTVPLGNTTGKCFVMRPSDYAITRPTEYNEADVFVCESKYFEEEKGIRKLKKGLKKFHLTDDCIEEEFFSIPYVPLRKEPTPQLNSISKETISDEQMNRNPAMAYSSVLQVSSMAQPMDGGPIGVIGGTPNKTITPGDADLIMTPRSPTMTMPQQQGNNGGVNPMIPNVSIQMSNPMFPLDVKKQSGASGDMIKSRKPPSGYVIFAGEQRKVMMKNRPDAQFGDISREVGQKWRQMPAIDRDIYERKAQQIKRIMEEEDKRIQLQQAMSSPPLHQQQQIIHSMGQQSPPVSMVHHPQSANPMVPFNPMPAMNNPYQVHHIPANQQPQMGQFFTDQNQQQHPQQPQPPQTQHHHNQQMIQIQMPNQAQIVSAPMTNQMNPQMNYPMQQQAQVTSHTAIAPSGINNATNNNGQMMQILPSTGVISQKSSPQQPPNNQAIIGQAQIIQAPHAHVVQPPQQQQQQHQQQQNRNQIGQPLFVSVPPKACRVLHSEVYQKYIDRLRKANVQGLSDWRNQMSASLEQHVNRNNYQASRAANQRNAIIEIAQKENAIANSFLNGVPKGTLSTDKVPLLGNKTQIEALWELRDYLLNDALNIKQRCLSLEEL